MNAFLAPVGFIKRSHTAFCIDVRWLQPFVTKSPYFPFLYSLFGESPDAMFPGTLGMSCGDAQNWWVSLSGALKSAVASLSESQRNNHNDWNCKNTSY